MKLFGYLVVLLGVFSLHACAVPASVRFEDNEDLSTSSSGPNIGFQPNASSAGAQKSSSNSPQPGMNSATMQQGMQQQQMMNAMRKNMMSGGMSAGSAGMMSSATSPAGGTMSQPGGKMPMILDNSEMPGSKSSDSGPDSSVMQGGTVGTLGGGPPPEMPAGNMPSGASGPPGGSAPRGGGPDSVIKGGAVGSLGGGPPVEFK